MGARHAGRVEPLPYSGERDAATGLSTHVPSQTGVRGWPMRSAACLTRVSFRWFWAAIVRSFSAPCSLKRRGRFGLLFIDGHADFYQPAANPNGEAASMDLAFATEYGPALLTDLEHRGPLVRPADTVAFGFGTPTNSISTAANRWRPTSWPST